MLTIENKKRVIAKADHLLLTEYLKKNKIEKQPTAVPVLQALEHGELVDDHLFPWEFIRLNSKVVIRDKMARLNYTYTIVMPELADHRQCRVSVFSEIGSVLFGNSRGNDIHWNTPKGKRYFTIMAVSQFDFK
jgi:transcription elongation GreA/GreB family factor